MVGALHAGERAHLRVDPLGYKGAIALLERTTNPETGRVGYKPDMGTEARPAGLDARFPLARTRAMTAAGLHIRFLCGQDPKAEPLCEKGVSQCLDVLPDWNPDKGSIDMYYWYYGTLALSHVGGPRWGKWFKALQDAVQRHQHPKGAGARTGSWDPLDPWATDGGRVYSTALMTLTLEQLPVARGNTPSQDPRLRPALAVLKAALRHEDEQVRDAARRALR
jgi:hypothetical protein